MRTLFYTAIIGFLLAGTVFIAQGQQNYLYQVIVLNEGHYKYPPVDSQVTPVTIGSYNPISGAYTTKDEITGARYASDVIIDGEFIYVAADSFLIKYNKTSFSREAVQIVKGIRKLAIWNDHILVSRGELYKSFASYFQVYDKNDLSFQYQLDTVTSGIKHSSEGIVIKDNTAYLAVNNGFNWPNYVGYIGIIDLNLQAFQSNIDLGVGKNPDNLMIEGDYIYTLNNHDFTTASVSSYNIGTAQTQNFPLYTPSGCNSSVLYAEDIYFQAAFADTIYTPETSISIFNTTSKTVDGTLPLNKAFYGLAVDPINSILYGSVTNYVDNGKVYRYDLTGSLLDSFSVSASPGNFAFDVRKTTAVSETMDDLSISIYPNPIDKEMHIRFDRVGDNMVTVRMDNIVGQTVVGPSIIEAGSTVISITELPQGIYLLIVKSGQTQTIRRVVKN